MFDNSWHLTIPLVVAKFPIIETNRTQIILFLDQRKYLLLAQQSIYTYECAPFDGLDSIFR